MRINPYLSDKKYTRRRDLNYTSDGQYFVTICVRNQRKVLGEVKHDKVILNQNGKTIRQVWLELPRLYKNFILGEYVIMPNHLHGIIEIRNKFDLNLRLVGEVIHGSKKLFRPVASVENIVTAGNHSLTKIIRNFKTISAERINKFNENKIFEWQRSFYDQIIINQEDLNTKEEDILNNPKDWANDYFYK